MMETRTRGERERFHAVHFEQFACHQAQKRLHQPQRVKGKILYRRKGQHERNPSHSLTLLYSVRTSARLDSTRFFDQLEWGEKKKKKKRNSIIFFNFSTFLFLLFVLPPLMDFVSVWTRGAAQSQSLVLSFHLSVRSSKTYSRRRALRLALREKERTISTSLFKYTAV